MGIGPGGIIGVSPAMERVFELVERTAPSDCSILITGENGTGKELLAKTIHRLSPRRRGPFVPINCAAIPEGLVESELFGHEKGSFTGALNSRRGRFELAHRGTLFLDEIGDLDVSMQAKLLRVLQEREFQRVGGTDTIRVDVRIVAATNQDLDGLIKERKFRQDLFYRLNVVEIKLPPLRERKEDISLLLAHFLEEFSRKMQRTPPTFTEEVRRCLAAYPWPGNVREMRNLIESLMILVQKDVVTPEDLPERFRSYCDHGKGGGTRGDVETLCHLLNGTEIPDEGIDLSQAINVAERTIILKALKKAGGRKSRAAGLLGIKRTTLIHKMKRMGLA